DQRYSKGALVAFAAIFFSEWGDVGQITAATMAARFGAPLLVWAGAVAAMATKGALAASIGASVRQWIVAHIQPKVIRYVGVSALLVLGLLSVIETLTERKG
ncbi:MAG: TMEM165/GDT1 family protein, partial [Bryobacteraceae bacterium]